MKIKFGSIVTDGSGKLGGHVYSKNRGGNYVRTNRTPANPQSIAQQVIRNILTQFTQGWSQLTEVERASWNNAVDLFSRTDQFGDVRKLSGKNLYQSLNNVLVASGRTPLTIAPQPEQLGDAIVEQAELNTASSTVSIFGRFTSGERYAIIGTAPVTAGTNFVKNRLRVLGYLTADAIDNFDNFEEQIYGLYIEKFGTPPAGSKVFLGVYAVNEVGQRSTASTVSTVVVG